MRARRMLDSDELRREQCSQFPISKLEIGLSTEDVRGDVLKAEDGMRIVDGTEPASSSRIMDPCYCSPAAAIVRQRKIESHSTCSDCPFPCSCRLVCERVWKLMASASSTTSRIIKLSNYR